MDKWKSIWDFNMKISKELCSCSRKGIIIKDDKEAKDE